MDAEVQKPGIILVLSGPSGAGKSTVCKRVLKQFPNLDFSVSCTTRKPRDGEQHGVDYFFLDEDQFRIRLQQQHFLEYAEVHGNFYGTLKSEVLERVKQGESVLLDIDVQGMRLVRQAAAADPELARHCLFVFFAPPSFSELESRLRKRGTEDEASVQKRLNNARGELDAWREFDALVVNEDPDVAAEDLLALLRSSQLRIDLQGTENEWPCGE